MPDACSRMARTYLQRTHGGPCYAPKLLPQLQDFVAFGFENLKPPLMSAGE